MKGGSQYWGVQTRGVIERLTWSWLNLVELDIGPTGQDQRSGHYCDRSKYSSRLD